MVNWYRPNDRNIRKDRIDGVLYYSVKLSVVKGRFFCEMEFEICKFANLQIPPDLNILLFYSIDHQERSICFTYNERLSEIKAAFQTHSMQLFVTTNCICTG